MQAFKVRHWECLESPLQEPNGGVIEPGFQAPGEEQAARLGRFLGQDDRP
jgi:hypothetical protein